MKIIYTIIAFVGIANLCLFASNPIPNCSSTNQCANCPEAKYFTNNAAILQTGIFAADDTLISNSTIDFTAQGLVTFQAGSLHGEYIELTSGFRANGNVSFLAVNIGCDATDDCIVLPVCNSDSLIGPLEYLDSLNCSCIPFCNSLPSDSLFDFDGSVAFNGITFFGENNHEFFGNFLSDAGDVNNDGYDDFITGTDE